MLVLPAGLERFRVAAATFGEACIADFPFVGKHLTARSFHGCTYLGSVRTCNTLIALAVVVGANIENRVIFAVVPTDEFIVCLCEREEIMAAGSHRLPFLHLCKEPTAADDGRCFQEFHRAGGTHLAADDTGQVILHVDDVDSHDFLFIHHQAQDSLEGLCLIAFPMEILADNDVLQREIGIFIFRTERKLAIDLSVPEQTAVAVSYFLLPFQRSAFGCIVPVQAETNTFSGEKAHGECRFCRPILSPRCEGGSRMICLLSSRSVIGNHSLLVCHLLNDWFQLFLCHRHFLQDAGSPLRRDLLEILLARRDDESAHIQSTWRD